ncbi:hydroxyethylthiazole kinase [Rhizobium sp. YIM 134829]|uniref:hydroxyethylthiazole kinase n=1 Tax=Rhizobium sp. YIM 134829 TaxID=3390453 RepID=UPI00397C3DA5
MSIGFDTCGFTGDRAAEILQRVRQRRPRVHCLMNTVVQKFTADGITAIGAIPSMTGSPEEIADFVDRADALTINLGTLDAGRRAVIETAVERAAARGIPWVIDPVHCDYSPTRLAFARALMARNPTAVRGNRAEMALIGEREAGLTIVTGPADLLRDGDRTLTVRNGHALMAAVTGTGCLSGGVIAAFMAVEPDPLLAAGAALATTGVAAELAAIGAPGPGSFGMSLLDRLYALTAADLAAHAHFDGKEGRSDDQG